MSDVITSGKTIYEFLKDFTKPCFVIPEVNVEATDINYNISDETNVFKGAKIDMSYIGQIKCIEVQSADTAISTSYTELQSIDDSQPILDTYITSIGKNEKEIYIDYETYKKHSQLCVKVYAQGGFLRKQLEKTYLFKVETNGKLTFQKCTDNRYSFSPHKDV